jgi:serine/threonine-protein kinase
MSITAGSRLSYYEVLGPLGAGAMGEVWRARDTRLDRQVAIKVLPEHFAKDAERLQRFEREAKALASLNHPNVAQIFGFENVGDTCFLVLELVPGETLAERLARGPLPVEEALNVCVQIAAGVEAAHEAGVIHRDLKPGNVKLTADGKAKVLDFGLARQETPKARPASGAAGPLTEEGLTLGTPGYMSPEQVRGKPIDRRTDIFAFGCVLYACLVGTAAFPGETSSDVIAALLESEPDFAALPSKASPRVRELLAKCLEKDAAHRLRDIGDARIELERAIAKKDWSTTRLATIPERRGWRSVSKALMPWLAGGLFGAGASALVTIFAAPGFRAEASSAKGSPPIATRFVVNPAAVPAAGEFDTTATLAISPDGARVAFLARNRSDGEPMLYVRELTGLDAIPVAGSTRAHEPCFSPDGAWLLFAAEDRLWKAPVAGGPRIEVARLPGIHKGSTWGEAGILCSPAPTGGLFRLSPDGGELEALTEPDASKGESSHRWPELLPDGRHVLYTVKKRDIASFDEAEIAVYSLDTHESKTLLRGGSFAKYASSGHLVYMREGALMAVPFDLERLEVTGPAMLMVPGVMSEPGSGAAQFDLSRNGTLVFAPGGAFENTSDLVWVHRDGTVSLVGIPARPFRDLALSPDGKKIAVVIAGATDAIFVYDLARGTLTRATYEGNSASVAWTPDGQSLVYGSDRDSGGMFQSRADGSGAAIRLLATRYLQFSVANQASKTGLLYAKGGLGQRDLWMHSMDAEAGERPVIETPFDEWGAVLSPDGRWLAYISNESGQYEVYARPFPAGPGRWQISKDGAIAPMWSADGTQLYFLSGSLALTTSESEGRRSVVAVSVSTAGEFTPGPPRTVFEWDGVSAVCLAPDGEKILTLRRRAPAFRPTEIHAVLNWVDELKAKTPVH